MKNKRRRTNGSFEQSLQHWMRRHYAPARVDEARALPLRQDMVTLLTYVRDHKLTGTQSTGNMPLKAIREVTAQFVVPPVLDTTIGDHTYKLRTEYDVWPLHFLHILAAVGGLLIAEPGRRWRLTPDAAQFLEADPVFQLSWLLSVWWFHVNWLVAFPVGGIGESLPASFERATLARLRSLDTETEVSFDAFADALIEQTGLTWSTPDMTYARMSLHSGIRRMVIDVLAKFGAVTCSYRDTPLIATIKDLDAFQITPLGATLLDSPLIEEGEP
jgi:hypothetical protein